MHLRTPLDNELHSKTIRFATRTQVFVCSETCEGSITWSKKFLALTRTATTDKDFPAFYTFSHRFRPNKSVDCMISIMEQLDSWTIVTHTTYPPIRYGTQKCVHRETGVFSCFRHTISQTPPLSKIIVTHTNHHATDDTHGVWAGHPRRCTVPITQKRTTNHPSNKQ